MAPSWPISSQPRHCLDHQDSPFRFHQNLLRLWKHCGVLETFSSLLGFSPGTRVLSMQRSLNLWSLLLLGVSLVQSHWEMSFQLWRSWRIASSSFVISWLGILMSNWQLSKCLDTHGFRMSLKKLLDSSSVEGGSNQESLHVALDLIASSLGTRQNHFHHWIPKTEMKLITHPLAGSPPPHRIRGRDLAVAAANHLAAQHMKLQTTS